MLKKFAAGLSILALAAACAVEKQPFSASENAARARSDRLALYQGVEPLVPGRAVGLDEAIARAVLYNLDGRVEMLNSALAEIQSGVASFEMLPKLAASAGMSERSNDLASTSTTILTRQNSTEAAVSQERRTETASLGLSWNILDFGVSYIRAKQVADKALMAEEQRRKTVQNIVSDVRYAYWRAVAAERQLGALGRLQAKTQLALVHARASAGVRDPLAELAYERALLATVERVKALRRDLVAAKGQLAALMCLPPGLEYSLAMPKVEVVHKVNASVSDMEDVALLNRPELKSAAYNVRQLGREKTRILLEMLPGVSLSGSGNYDSNKFNLNHAWMTGGASIAWNLMAMVAAPSKMDAADKQVEAETMKRRALSLAIIAQVNISALRFAQAQDEYSTAVEQASVEDRAAKITLAQAGAAQVGELQVIQAQADQVFSALRKDALYAAVQNAYGAVMVSLGADPLPAAVTGYTVSEVTAAVHYSLARWQDGSALRAGLATLREQGAVAAAPAVAPSAPNKVPGGADAPRKPVVSLAGGGALIVGGAL